MRSLILVCLLAATAHADVGVAGSVGAGAQGASTYSALELRLDVAWTTTRLGLGVRGVWDDDVFRTSDWSGPERAVTMLRAFETTGRVGDVSLGLAAGALAPGRLGRVVDDYHVALDDRWRTGVRAVARSEDVDAQLEIDDVLDPAVIGGAMRWQMLHAAVAVDPDRMAVVELGVHHTWERDGARAEVGGSVLGELLHGGGVLTYGDAAIDYADITWSARADVRATTSGLSPMGPLYRVERTRDDRHPLSAGLALGAATHAWWVQIAGRESLISASAGAPMSKHVQAAVWAAANGHDAAGASELRVLWSNKMFSALQAARLYRFETMDPVAVWSVTAWFGISRE
jgi:hypothetical protein